MHWDRGYFKKSIIQKINSTHTGQNKPYKKNGKDIQKHIRLTTHKTTTNRNDILSMILFS